MLGILLFWGCAAVSVNGASCSSSTLLKNSPGVVAGPTKPGLSVGRVTSRGADALVFQQNPSSIVLAQELFNESNWAAAQLESRRTIELFGPSNELASCIEAAAALRMSPTNAPAFAALLNLASNAISQDVRAFSLSEIGFTQWGRNEKDKALVTLTHAYQESRDSRIRARASFGVCILFLFTKATPDVDAYWEENLLNCIPSWTPEIRRSGAIRPPPESRRSFWSMPGMLIVSLYRSQIAPAIGNRCTLEPSCSEYFLQASRKRGWLGFAMMGDRLIREPSVVKAGEKPVLVKGISRYADPVEDHVPTR